MVHQLQFRMATPPTPPNTASDDAESLGDRPRVASEPPAIAAARSAASLERARGRLADRGIDPRLVLGRGPTGDDITVTGLYLMLGVVGATEKAGQSPTFALARLALRADLPSAVADTLFLAYNQQSAEEAGHGDKVFGNAYYAMGGADPEASQSIVGNGGPGLQAGDDPKQNKKLLAGVAGVLGGIETVALNRVFPQLAALCQAWKHPIAADLLMQIRDTVRPEESRHVLIWRYVFHHLIAPKGDAVIDVYQQASNTGRRMLADAEFDRPEFLRMMGTAAPTARQLLGKDRLFV